MENRVTTNDKVLALLSSRLKMGQEKYGQDIPIQGEGGRDNFKESIEESADLAVYLTATLLELEQSRNNKTTGDKNCLSIKPEHIQLILSGLYSLRIRKNNALNICDSIDKLIEDIKKTCKWNAKDEKTIMKMIYDL